MPKKQAGRERAIAFVPEQLQEPLLNFLWYGISPSNPILIAALDGDYIRAGQLLHDGHRELAGLISFIETYVPDIAHGSRMHRRRWAAWGGLAGHEEWFKQLMDAA